MKWYTLYSEKDMLFASYTYIEQTNKKDNYLYILNLKNVVLFARYPNILALIYVVLNEEIKLENQKLFLIDLQIIFKRCSN